jgi:hypothetical protein
LRETLNDDTHVVGEDIEKLTAFRLYLAEMQAAIVARRHGQASPPVPPADDPRAAFTLTLPNLAAYEAAKDNGAVALLSSQRMRLYNRIAFSTNCSRPCIQDGLMTSRRSEPSGAALIIPQRVTARPPCGSTSTRFRQPS